MFTDLYVRLRALFRRRRVEQELADELHFHLEHAIDKHVAAGMTRAEAARRTASTSSAEAIDFDT